MIIERPLELAKIKNANWVFVYGRRKTGKSFLVENFIDFDEFFFVRKDRTITEKTGWKVFAYETFKEVLRRDLEANRSVVVDEFHRLGEEFLEYIHALPQKGRLILISSTLHMARMLLDKRSPLLGRFGEVQIRPISLLDTLNALKAGISDPKVLMENAILMREPITVNLLGKGNIADAIGMLKMTVPGLTGEIFSEEDRKLTAVYEGTIRAIAAGKCVSGEISSHLFSRHLLGKDDPSLVQQYLDNLVRFGILLRVQVWGKKRQIYKHASPLTKMFYYLDERYGIGERDISGKDMAVYVQEMMPRVVEDSVREMVGELLGMRAFVHEAKDFEVDGIFATFKTAEVALEVIWGGNIRRADVIRAKENLERIPVERRMVFVPKKEKGLEVDGVELIDVGDLTDKNRWKNGTG